MQRRDMEHWSAKLRESWVKNMNEKNAFREKWLRLAAEFENYKRLSENEKRKAIEMANEKFIEQLIPILNNFRLALTALKGSESPNLETMLKGVEMIFRQFSDFLESQGLKVIEPEGEKFDPRFHEAIEIVETADVEPETVIKAYEPGYLFKGKLIRPAKVAVAKPPAQKEQETQEEGAQSAEKDED